LVFLDVDNAAQGPASSLCHRLPISLDILRPGRQCKATECCEAQKGDFHLSSAVDQPGIEKVIAQALPRSANSHRFLDSGIVVK
jgi:hypothetical protein